MINLLKCGDLVKHNVSRKIFSMILNSFVSTLRRRRERHINFTIRGVYKSIKYDTYFHMGNFRQLNNVHLMCIYWIICLTYKIEDLFSTKGMCFFCGYTSRVSRFAYE